MGHLERLCSKLLFSAVDKNSKKANCTPTRRSMWAAKPLTYNGVRNCIHNPMRQVCGQRRLDGDVNDWAEPRAPPCSFLVRGSMAVVITDKQCLAPRLCLFIIIPVQQISVYFSWSSLIFSTWLGPWEANLLGCIHEMPPRMPNVKRTKGRWQEIYYLDPSLCDPLDWPPSFGHSPKGGLFPWLSGLGL